MLSVAFNDVETFGPAPYREPGTLTANETAALLDEVAASSIPAAPVLQSYNGEAVQSMPVLVTDPVTGEQTTVQTVTPGATTQTTTTTPGTSTTGAGLIAWAKANPMLAMGAAALIAWGIYEFTKNRSK